MPTVRYTVLNGEVIADKRAGVRRLYVPDPLGSTVALLDSTQAKTDTFSYWPYGEEASRTGTTPTPFRFVGTHGYYRDRVASVYVRARHYRPDVGRWLTDDPVGLAGGDLNTYRYVEDCPVILRDRSGLAQVGVDYCGCDGPRHPEQDWRECRKPRKPCPNGGKWVCVSCYGSDAPGGDAISYPGICGTRPPVSGDCAISPSCQACHPGDWARIGGSGPSATPGCRVCDDGNDITCGIDVFVQGPEEGCDRRLRGVGGGWYPRGTGWYCVDCFQVTGVTYPTGDYPCYVMRPRRPQPPRPRRRAR